MPQPNRQVLLLFMRHPQPGQVKTRLAATVGDEQALQIYVKLLRRTLGILVDFKRLNPQVHVRIFCTPETDPAITKAQFPGPWLFHRQRGSHLGERMELAFRDCWDLGYRQALLVGTDIADLRVQDLQTGFDGLNKAGAVLGPTHDGGFYLIGFNRTSARNSALLPEIWGTSDVFQRTRLLLESSGLIVRSTPRRHDIDTAEDLKHLFNLPCFSRRLSIIIPTVAEPAELRPLLDRLRRGLWPGDEIIVVRGRHGKPEFNHGENGSAGNPEIPQSRVTWLRSELGRGHQLHQGFRAATGDLLWFLHDDCEPPDHFAYHVRRIDEAPTSALGCFQTAYNPTNKQLDWIARWANFRTRYFRLPYGDQGLFCLRKDLEQLGGFPELMLMEDVALATRLAKSGNLLVIDEPIFTSPKRYLERGILRASLQNHLLVLLYHLGVDDRTLHRLYYAQTRSRPDRRTL